LCAAAPLQFANISELFLELVDKYEAAGNVEALVEHRKEVLQT
jgi:hypothetical protein